MKRRLNLSKLDSTAVGIALLFAAMALIDWIWPRPLGLDQTVEVRVESNQKPDPRGETESNIDHRIIVERPLFTVDRKPYVVPVDPPVVRPPPASRRPPEPEPSFSLNAVIRTPDTEIAIVTVNGQSQTHKLKPGEVLERWSLREVRQDSVVFTRDAKEKIVWLKPDEQLARR